MRSAKTLVVASLLSAATISAGHAADAITIPISTESELPVAGQAGFDWDGFYAGVHGGGLVTSEGAGAVLGAHVGVNAQFNFYLLGVEVAVTGLTEADGVGASAEGQILGRAGLVVSDDAVVYAAGGYGIDLAMAEGPDVLVGGGVELGVTDSLSVRAQYLHSFPVQDDTPSDTFTLGASIHF